MRPAKPLPQKSQWGLLPACRNCASARRPAWTPRWFLQSCSALLGLAATTNAKWRRCGRSRRSGRSSK
eukprot:1135673-Karenia_brevis.AAC.1